MKEKIICNTQCKKIFKVADAVSRELNIPLADIKDAHDGETDLLILFGGGKLSGEAQSGIEGYVKNLKKNTVKAAAIVTLDSNTQNVSVSDALNVKSNQTVLRKLLQEKDIEVLDEHICLCRYFVFYLLHPNKTDIRKTVDWLQGVRKLVK